MFLTRVFLLDSINDLDIEFPSRVDVENGVNFKHKAALEEMTTKNASFVVVLAFAF